VGNPIQPAKNPPGTTIMLVSPNGLYGRLIGVRDDGSTQDDIVSLT
jgi:hypothetical protein